MPVKDKSRNGKKDTDEQSELTEEQRNEALLLQTLAQLGGQRVSTDNLKFQGKELILPETMSVADALEFLSDWQEAQEEETRFSRVFKYRPNDGAHALQSAMKKVFGTAGIQKPTWTFFGKKPPEQRSIPIGVETTTQVPWGEIEVPIFEGTMYVTESYHKELGPLFQLIVDAPKKFQANVEGLFVIVEKELKEHSIYRGQAVDGQQEPEFIDLRGVDPRKVIFSNEVRAQLEANVWSLLRYTAMQRSLKMPLKRANLVYGPFGTGKTLAGFRTAQIAVENSWTFIYCRPARDDIGQVMATARLYQPCVVFVEDIDALASSGEDDQVTRLLDLFDGIQAKGTEIMVVMTTNHAERIHAGMLRPGRLDSMIEISTLDTDGVRQMIESVVPEKMIHAEDLDYEAIHAAMDGYLPAFIKESIDRAIRYALVREEGLKPTNLATEDFVLAAEGLRPQWEMMNDAGEGKKRPTLEVALEPLMERAAAKANDRTIFVPPNEEQSMEGGQFALRTIGE